MSLTIFQFTVYSAAFKSRAPSYTAVQMEQVGIYNLFAYNLVAQKRFREFYNINSKICTLASNLM